MLVASTLNPSNRSSVQFLVVHFDDERVLVPTELHAKYSDLQGFVMKEWGFESSEVFNIETDELDICAGKRVRVHEEAWFGIKDIVGNVYVRIRRSEHELRELLRNQRHDPLAPVKDEVKQEDVLTSRAASESADEAEVEQQTRTEIPRNEVVEETPTVRRRGKEPEQDKKDRPESLSKKKLQGDTLNLFSDEADAGTSARGGAQKDKEQQKNESGPSKENATAPRQTWKSFIDSLHRNTPNGNNNSNPPASASTLGTPAFNTPAPISKTRSKAESSSAQGASDTGAAAAAPASGADSERVLIVIEPPPDSIYEPRGFRIRREHSVKTVLKGACKAFKIDYTKTRLRMVTDVDENSQGDGELVTVKCDDTDTMNSLNVRDNQRFIIENTPEEEEEEEEEESEA